MVPRHPDDDMLTLNEWIGQKIGTDNWYVGESDFALAKPISLGSYKNMQSEYFRLYGDGPAISAAPLAGYFEIMARFAELPSWRRWLDGTSGSARQNMPLQWFPIYDR